MKLKLLILWLAKTVYSATLVKLRQHTRRNADCLVSQLKFTEPPVYEGPNGGFHQDRQLGWRFANDFQHSLSFTDSNVDDV